MHLRRIALQNFRNIAWAELAPAPAGAALIGSNAQGKTNFLEAVGLLTALRSFRQSDNRLLIAHGQPEAALRFELEHERLGATSVTIRLRPDDKEVQIDATPVARFGEFLGRFPTVLFSSQDNQLIRGGPAARRRWLDLVLAAMDASYLDVLQRYHRALEGRNRLLKDRADAAQLAAFEQPLAAAGAAVIRARASGVAELGTRLRAAYATIAPQLESADLVYESDVAEEDEAALAGLFAANRERDQLLKSTTRGPHRDDIDLTLDGRSSRDFGSEGQQRSLVLALRLAQFAHFRERSGVRPVVLADDVLGELDAARRARFWTAIEPGTQVFATGTEPPGGAAPAWTVYRVERGTFTAESQP
ncbi:MAG TPA: DNA replication and repair protein RecF [Opitutaceae bacterium]|nr:DNA replication and repair protein RecF [Opitutaceae bacterium]